MNILYMIKNAHTLDPQKPFAKRDASYEESRKHFVSVDEVQYVKQG